MLPLSQSINSSLQNDSFDEKKARGYANGSHCEVEISKMDNWDARHIYDRGIKLLHFMEERWKFKFESIEQMDELLHIGFANDGREIPEAITEDTTPDLTNEEDDERTKTLIAIIMKWADGKESTGAIHVDKDKCDVTYCRFTTDTLTSILPDASEAKSGWNTKNHYFCEVVNKQRTRVKTGNKGNIITLQVALSGKHIPDDLKAICERIDKHFPSKPHHDNWYWRIPFSTERAVIPFDMKEDGIFDVLDTQYEQFQTFEKQLVDIIGRE
jgi:hypothetical protein